MALILDCEVYRDYFLICFLDRHSGKVASFEMHSDKKLDVSKVSHLMRSNTTISFNGNNYDLPMVAAALENRNCEELKRISDAIIKSNLPSWRVCKENGRKPQGLRRSDWIPQAARPAHSAERKHRSRAARGVEGVLHQRSARDRRAVCKR